MFKHEAQLRVTERQAPQAKEWLDQQEPGIKQRIMDRLQKINPFYREKALVREITREKTRIDFISPQVDSTLQGILVKAPVSASPEILRNAQLVKAKVIWSTTPMAVVPVLAVTRQGGQSFVFVAQQQNGHWSAHQVAVTLGDTVGNDYSVTSGLNAGDKVIVSSTQFLVNGMPVMLLGS